MYLSRPPVHNRFHNKSSLPLRFTGPLVQASIQPTVSPSPLALGTGSLVAATFFSTDGISRAWPRHGRYYVLTWCSSSHSTR